MPGYRVGLGFGIICMTSAPSRLGRAGPPPGHRCDTWAAEVHPLPLPGAPGEGVQG